MTFLSQRLSRFLKFRCYGALLLAASWAAIPELGFATAGPTLGTTPFPTGTVPSQTPNIPSPVTSTASGYTFEVVTVNASNTSSAGWGVLYNTASDLVFLNTDAVPGPPSYQSIPSYVGFKSADSSAFKLLNFVYVPATQGYAQSTSGSSIPTVTVTGYLNGVAVSGATSSQAMPLANFQQTLTWDVSSIAAFGKINEVRITTSDTTTIGGSFRISSISIAAAVTAPVLTSIAVTPTNPSIAKGATQQFTATGTYSDNSTQNLTSTVSWASATPGTATISSAGLATSVAQGTSVISATSGSVVGTTTLTVTSPPLVSIAITPANPSIAKGSTQQFTATGTYSDASTADLSSTVTWNSANTSVATLSSTGLASTAAVGTSSISATLGSVTSNSTNLTVTAATVVSVAVTPANPSIVNGGTQQFLAAATYTDGTTSDVSSSCAWTSSSTSVATVTTAAPPRGVATSVTSGTTTISAKYLGTTTGSTLLTITPATPATADLAISNAALTPTYTANSTVKYAVMVTNASSPAPVTATVTDTLPAGLTNVTWTGYGTNGGTGPASGTGDINASVVLYQGGATYTFIVSGTASATSGTLVSTATVTPAAGTTDTSSGNDSATATVTLSGLPAISSPVVTSLASTSLTYGANVTSDGGNTVTDRGVVYSQTSLNADPLIGGANATKMSASGTTGAFTVNLSSLSASTGYTLKAYATNSVGTTYTALTTTATQSSNTTLVNVTDTAQSDFQAGTLANVDATTLPGDAVLSTASAGVPDQQNPITSTTVLQLSTSTWVAQTFIPDRSGLLTQADFALSTAGSGATPNLTVSLRATTTNSTGIVPTGNDLVTATISGFKNTTQLFYPAIFATPYAVTAGTQYALLIRPTGTGVSYNISVSGTTSQGVDTYPGGTRVTGGGGGTSWSVPLTPNLVGGSTTDLAFRTYIAPYQATGSYTSTVKDSNPAYPGGTAWVSLARTLTTPLLGATVQLQVAASNSPTGPFNFVGPDGTASTYFTSSGASLSQFTGNRYLQYKAFFSTTDAFSTPDLSDVTVTYQSTVNNPVVIMSTASIAANTLTLTINGSGFDGTNFSNNVVTLSSGAGSVTAATSTSLTYTFTTPPSLGVLTASVMTGSSSSDSPVQVATVTAAPIVQFPSSGQTVSANAGTPFSFQVNLSPTSKVFASGFSSPAGLAFDSSGNLYVSNSGNNTISKVSSSGVVTPFASGFNVPGNIGFDSTGNLYVANGGAGTVSKVTPGGVVTTFASAFNAPTGIAVDGSNNVYVSNLLGTRVDQITPGGTVSSYANPFNAPGGLTFDSVGNLYVANFGFGSSNSVMKVTPGGAISTYVSGSGISGPMGLGFDSYGNMYVSNFGGTVVSQVTPGGVVTALPYVFNSPDGVAVDSAGNIYVANYGAGNVIEVTGVVSVPFTTATSSGVTVNVTNVSPIVFQPGQGSVTISGTVTSNGANGTATFTIGTPVGGGVGTQAVYTLTIGTGVASPQVMASPNLAVHNFSGGGSLRSSAHSVSSESSSSGSGSGGSSSTPWQTSTQSTTANMAEGSRTGVADPSAQTYYYKGTDNKLWAMYAAAGTTQWLQAPLLTNDDVSDWLAYAPGSASVIYQSTNHDLCCAFYSNGTWQHSNLTGEVVAGGQSNVAGDVVVDTAWNCVYYRGTDNQLWAVYSTGQSWVQSAIGTQANVAGHLAVDSTQHSVYYTDANNQLWQASVVGSQWTQTQVSTVGNVGGAVTLGGSGVIYYRSSVDNSAWAMSPSGDSQAQTQVDASVSLSEVATLYSTGNLLCIDSAGHCQWLSQSGGQWATTLLGDSSSVLTEGLSASSTLNLIYCRSSDGHIIVFYY